MLQIVLDCPHCGTKKTAATIHDAFASDTTDLAAFGSCNTCFRGVIVYGRSRSLLSHNFVRKALSRVTQSWPEIVEYMNQTGIAPNAPGPRNIAHLPPQVESAFKEAEEIYSHGFKSGAALGYRKAVERALKLIEPDAKGMLNARIRELEKSKGLPSSLIELLDTVKFLGNDAAHELTDPDPEDVDLGRDLTALLFTYLYELPGKLQIASEKRAAIKKEI